MSVSSNEPSRGPRPDPSIDAVQPSGSSTAASSPLSRLQLGAITALIIGYAALSQYSASADSRGLGAALSLAPVLLIGVVLAWRWTRPLTALLITSLLCAMLYRYWPMIERHYEWADLAQQCGVYALVALGFWRSLYAGRIPFCTQLAEKMYGTLTPAETDYTRKATVAWAAFYALLAAVILMLFFVASLRIWSLFVNFATFGLMMLMGILDHAIRRRVLPRHPGGGILAIIRRSLTG